MSTSRSEFTTYSTFSTLTDIKASNHISNANDYITHHAGRDVAQEYVMPHVDYKEPKVPTIYREPVWAYKVDIPSRLDAPLEPYPSEVRNYIYNGCKDINYSIRPEHNKELRDIYRLTSERRLNGPAGMANITFDLPSLKKFIDYPYSERTNLIHNASMHHMTGSVNNDLHLMTDRDEKFMCRTGIPSRGASFMIMFQRIRALMTSGVGILNANPREATPIRDDSGLYIISADTTGYHYYIILGQNHFSITHTMSETIFIGPRTYFEYLYTMSGVFNNLSIIDAVGEYPNFRMLFKFLTDMATCSYNHNDVVDFFKAYEALCLYKADIELSEQVNWGPIIDSIKSMNNLSNSFTDGAMTYEEALHMFVFCQDVNNRRTVFANLMLALGELRPDQLIEASTLHKFLFYSEIEAERGLEKFLKRTHTKRVVDKNNVKMMMGMTKMEFTINYHKKEGVSPKIEGPEEKALIIYNALEKRDYNKLQGMGLAWWIEIIFGKTFELIDAGNPVEYAKDKGAIKYDLCHHPKDNEKELYQIMNSVHYEADDFLKDISRELKESNVYWTKSSEFVEKHRFPARLCKKEKEAKREGRFFGVATAPFKHKMSQYQESIKMIIDYLDSQTLTMSDYNRKKLQHKMAQTLSDDDNFAIMADIEGHNQSMQPDNCSDILLFFGQLFGFDDWDKLSYIFNNLHVYYYDTYLDKVLVSEGQLGGIEGWMNPVWTAVTCQQFKLISHTTSLSVIESAMYSDDIVQVHTIKDASQATINNTLWQLGKEIYRQGFILKASQCAVSKTRTTLLRQHTINGLKVDSTLKRLMAVSACNNSRLYSDEIEIDGISSSISGALDGSYHIHTCLALKWYKSFLLTSYIVGSLFRNKQENSMLSMDNIPAEIASIFYVAESMPVKNKVLNKETFVESLAINYGNTTNLFGETHKKEAFEYWLLNICQANLTELKSHIVNEVLLYISTEHIFLHELWQFILLMPVQLGGLGIELFNNQALSGHSDGLMKQIYSVHRIIRDRFRYKTYFYNCLEASLKFSQNIEMSHREDKLFTSKWILNPTIHTARSMLNARLTEVMRSSTKNLELLRVLEYKEMDPIVRKALMIIFRDEYSHRMCQFYYENTLMSIVQFLLKKLETSTSMINRIKNLTTFKKRISERSRINVMNMLSLDNCLELNIDADTDILSLMISRRSSLCPLINFVDIEEPLYDHMLKEAEEDNEIMILHASEPLVYHDGLSQLRQGFYESRTMYKGEMVKDDILLNSREDMIIAKVVSVTQWAILKTEDSIESPIPGGEFNFLSAARVCLRTFTTRPFEDFMINVPLNLGGEILHRIPNQRFKNKISTKILPNSTQICSVSYNQRNISSMQLEDSNINFEYIRMKLILKSAYNYHYYGILPITTFVALKSLENIVTVQDYKARSIDRQENFLEIDPTKYELRDISLQRVSINSLAYLYDPKLVTSTHQDNRITQISLDSLIENKYVRIIIDYYNKTNKEGLFLSMDTTNIEYWEPLFISLRRMGRFYRDMSDEEIMKDCKICIKDYIHKMTYDSLSQTYRGKKARQYDNLQASYGDFTDVFESMINAISHFGRSRKEKHHNVSVTSLRKKYESSINSMGRDMIMHLSFGSCLIAKRSNGFISLDPFATLENVIFTINNYTMSEILTEDDKMAIEIIGAQKLVNYGVSHRRSLLKKLNKVREKSDLLLDDSDNINIKYADTNAPLFDFDVPVSLYQINYEMVRISIDVLKEKETLSSLIKVCRRVSELYADPVSTFSYTGSDAMTSQFGILSKLLLDDNYTEGEIICSLTSGRGDILYAAEICGAPVHAYSKPDFFSKTYHHPKIIFDYDYDITDINTISFTSQYKHILIDISYLKGEPQAVWDTVLTLINQGKNVIIRVNSVIDWNEDTMNSLRELDVEIKFSYPQNRSVLPYQMYLMIYKKDELSSNIVHECYGSEILKIIYDHYISHCTVNNLCQPGDPNIQNSMTRMIKPDITVSDIHDMIFTNQPLNDLRMRLRRLMRESFRPSKVVIPSKIIIRIQDLAGRTFDPGMPTIVYDDWSHVTLKDISLDDRPKIKYWERYVDNVVNGRDHLVSYDLTKITGKSLWLLSRDHPLKEMREYLTDLFFLDQAGYKVVLSTDKELSIIHDRLVDMVTDVDTVHSKDVRIVLAITAMAAKNNSYKSGCMALLSEYRANKDDSSHSLKLLKMYRKMGGIYDRLNKEIYSNTRSYAIVDEINEKVLKPMFRKRTSKLVRYKKEWVPKKATQDDEKLRNTFEENMRNLAENLDILSPAMLNVTDDASLRAAMTKSGVEVEEIDFDPEKKKVAIDTILNLGHTISELYSKTFDEMGAAMAEVEMDYDDNDWLMNVDEAEIEEYYNG